MFAPNKLVIVTREQLKKFSLVPWLTTKLYALWIYGILVVSSGN
jgi:hypothetical protein